MINRSFACSYLMFLSRMFLKRRKKETYTALCRTLYRVQLCTIGCSDFDLFSHFEVQPPIPDTLRAQGFGNWQKKFFNFIHGLRKFLAKTGKCVFLVQFQSLILGALNDRSLPFFQHFLFMESLIHIPNLRSLSQKLQSQENGQDRVQNLSVCKI